MTNIDIPPTGISQFEQYKQITNSKFKNTFFCDLFSDKKRFLELYNAISGDNYPDDTEAVLFPNNDLLSHFKDLAYVINNKLIVMVEHQSTINPNMPLRFLLYFADIVRTYIMKSVNIFKNTIVKIPQPEFYVLYNGKEAWNTDILKLSDAFHVQGGDYSMEIIAKIINIRHGCESKEMKLSKNLSGYSFLINLIETYISEGMSRDMAINKATKKCIESGILADYLVENQMEVTSMLNYEFNYEDALMARFLDGEASGEARGKIEGKIEDAKAMYTDGLPLEKICKYTGLSIEELEKLVCAKR